MHKIQQKNYDTDSNGNMSLKLNSGANTSS